MEMQTQTWTIGEFRFTVDTDGPVSGPPVLLLHGFPQTRHMWRHQLRALAAAGYRGVAPDQRGYSAGARPLAVESYASELLAADALALMDFCNARRFHLVGHDWGGQLAWLIAAGHPDRVATLTALSRPHPGAFARAMTEDPGQAKRSQHHTAFRQPDAISRLREDNFKTLRAVLEREGVGNVNLDAHFQTLGEPGGLEAAISWYRANNIASAAIPAVSVPTLYVWGTADASVGRRAAELTEQFVSGPYRFVEVEGGGHFIVDQFPDRIGNLTIEHLRGTSL
jgi:pimeloyl-ACP methyl ester carboxylesterase